MSASPETIKVLCALLYGVNQYLADIENARTPDDGMLRSLARAAQRTNFGELAPYAHDAFAIFEAAQHGDEGVDEWAMGTKG